MACVSTHSYTGQIVNSYYIIEYIYVISIGHVSLIMRNRVTVLLHFNLVLCAKRQIISFYYKSAITNSNTFIIIQHCI